MNVLLPPAPVSVAFVIASVALAVSPGPGVLYIVARSLAHGRRIGLASVAGVALGNLGNAIFASAGIAVILAASAQVFSVIRYAGAIYLVYLGIRVLRSTGTRRSESAPVRGSLARTFRDGFLVALLNPKTTLFFAAFLPQFIGATASPMIHGIVLGAVFVAIAALTDSAYALAAGAIAPMLAGKGPSRSIGRYLGSGTLVALGIFTAFGGPRGSA